MPFRGGSRSPRRVGRARSNALAVTAAIATLASAHSHAARADDYFLRPGDAQVGIEQTITVSLHTIDANRNLVPNTIDLSTSLTWTLNGKTVDAQNAADGHLAPSEVQGQAVYTAPHAVPAKNPVAVAVSFRPTPTGPALTLVANITVVDKGNFFSLTGPFQDPTLTHYQLNDQFSGSQVQSMLAHAMTMNGMTQVSVAPMEPGATHAGAAENVSARLTLTIAGTAPGDYAWSLPGATATTVMAQIGSAKGLDLYLSADCVPHGNPNCQAVPLKGTTKILSIDPATHVMRGTFSGLVVRSENGRPTKYASLTGTFRVATTGIGAPTFLLRHP